MQIASANSRGQPVTEAPSTSAPSGTAASMRCCAGYVCTLCSRVSPDLHLQQTGVYMVPHTQGHGPSAATC